MKAIRAKQLLSRDISIMSFEQILKHKVNLNDALKQSKAANGYIEAVNNGFYSADTVGNKTNYYPIDKQLTQTISKRLNDIEGLLNTKYAKVYYN